MHLLLAGTHEWISDAVYNKYKTNHYDGASAKVTTFYLGRFKQEDCLQRLEEIADVTDKGAIAAMQAEAEKKEKEKLEAKEAERYQRVQVIMAASVQGGQDDSDDEEGTMEEVDLRSDAAPGLTLSDSGYGSCLGDAHAGDSSPGNTGGSPAKRYIDDTIPPLVLPDHYNYSPIRRSPQQQQQSS